MNRLDILKNLVYFEKPLQELVCDLSALDWDYHGEPYIVYSGAVATVIERYLDENISAEELEEWANLLECREDLDFEEAKQEVLSCIIYDLANPTLQGDITYNGCKDKLIQLKE